MQNINPSKTRTRRANFYMLIGVPLLMGGLIMLASIAFMTQLPIFGSVTTIVMVLFFFMGLPSVIGGGISVYRAFNLTEDNEVAYEVGEILARTIGGDPRYRFIRNVSKRGLGYIDAVLVGPPGALVFRIVNYHGFWRNERTEWRIKDKDENLRAAPFNPSRECARDVYALRKYLDKRRLDKIPVYGVVVFTDPQVVLQGQGQVVPITKVDRMYEIISRDYLLEERIAKPQIEATVDAIIDG